MPINIQDNNEIFQYIQNNAKNLHILLVEDDHLLSKEYELFFSRLFVHIDKAYNGLEGLEAASKKKYDLIITDIMMPLSGLSMIQKIKERYPDQAVLVISAYQDTEKLHQALRIGVDCYLFKPLDIKQVMQALYKIVSNFLVRKENALYKQHLEELVLNKSQELIETYTVDSVTQLFSLSKLQEDLKQLSNYSLCVLKIKNFKSLNDFYGYEVGNSILLQTATFLKKALPHHPHLQSAKLYRISGAHFAMLAPVDAHAFETEVYTIIKDYETTEVTIQDQMFYLELSAGIVGRKDEITLSHADFALRLSEKSKAVVIYENDTKKIEAHAMKIKCHDAIKRALIEDRFVPFYHPIVDNQTNTIIKYEALARLIMPDGEIILPSCFLPVSKHAKTYNMITVAIIEKALQDFYHSECSVSLNISIDDIEDKQTRDYILAVVSLFPEPQRIIFELLESENITSYHEVKEFFKELKKIGCKVAIDDFGSGYSNFEHIAKLNVDYIKIDGSLISALEQDFTSLTIVEMLSAFATKMHIRTIAEYVANTSLHTLVHSIGLNESQGYVFGEPIPYNESMKYIQDISTKDRL
jgi:EAL domain-containing protein (putative c-di-GMP-specific phosphodiesterase class I)/PleD family two-component response regulator